MKIARLFRRRSPGDNFACYLRGQYGSCNGLRFYREHEGKRYCVLHFPGENKEDDFKKALDEKLGNEDFNFAGAFFPSSTAQFEDCVFSNANFSDAKFSGGANFSNAEFSGGTIFSNAEFSGAANYSNAKFSGGWVHFSKAIFCGETDFERAEFRGEEARYGEQLPFSGGWTIFRRAEFRGARTWFSETKFITERAMFDNAKFTGGQTYFSYAEFRGRDIDFSDAEFSGADVIFSATTFDYGANFAGTIFRGRVAFSGTVFGPKSTVRFDHALIDKPELFSFDAVRLRPSCFVNVDVRRVDFTRVEWPKFTAKALEGEIATVQSLQGESPHALLARTCQRLAANAEESRDYPTANEFHYWSMEALRRQGWWNHLGLVGSLYWVLSGYGERPRRAFFVLAAIWLSFTALYLTVGAAQFPALTFPAPHALPHLDFGEVGRAAAYSLSALARLTPAEPKLSPGWFQFLVTVEGLLGPLQIALFLLAVRRKVMR